MTRKRQDQATLVVDLNELNQIIGALIAWSRPPDPGLLAYLSTKRENLRKRIGETASAPVTSGGTSLQTYVITSEPGERRWQAEDADHAREQHEDAFPDEPLLSVRLDKEDTP